MSTLDIADLDAALTRLTDTELQVFIARMSGLAHSFHDTDDGRVRDVFAALAVLAAEQQDHRQRLAEHARRELDGDDDTGCLLSEWADMPNVDDPDL